MQGVHSCPLASSGEAHKSAIRSHSWLVPAAVRKHRPTTQKKYKMPWLALTSQSPEATQISKSIGVPHIPYLVILDPDRKIVSKNGKKEIARSGEAAFAAWKKLTK